MYIKSMKKKDCILTGTPFLMPALYLMAFSQHTEFRPCECEIKADPRARCAFLKTVTKSIILSGYCEQDKDTPISWFPMRTWWVSPGNKRFQFQHRVFQVVSTRGITQESSFTHPVPFDFLFSAEHNRRKSEHESWILYCILVS